MPFHNFSDKDMEALGGLFPGAVPLTEAEVAERRKAFLKKAKEQEGQGQ